MNELKHKLLSVGAWACLLTAPAAAAPKNAAKTKPVPPRTHLEGYLGERIDACIRGRVMSEDESLLVAPFRQQNETHAWQSEFWGKWTLGAIASYRYNGDPELLQKIRNGVELLLSVQLPDGYIGNYAPEAQLTNWDVWGRKYTLLGLLAYYDLSGNKKVLEAVQRLADHLLTQIPSQKSIVEVGLYRGMPPSSILEPMVALYDRTGDKRYLDFAEYIVAQWETERGPRLIGKALEGVPVSQRFVPDTKQEAWWSWDNGQKACEMMSCYDGLLDLYKITGKPEYLEAVHKSVRNILDEEIDIAGSGRATTCLEDVGLAIRFAAWIFFARLFVSIYRKRRVPRRAPDKPVQRQDGGFGNGSRPMAWRLSGSEPSPERSGRSRVGGTLSRRKSKGILSTHAPDVVS